MNDYSDLFLVIAAMIMYSVLLVDINATVLQGSKYKMDREAEYTAVALAQDLIDEARWVPYDQFGARFAGRSDTLETSLGTYRRSTQITANSLTAIGVSNDHIQLDVRVESMFSSDSVSVLLSYVKN